MKGHVRKAGDGRKRPWLCTYYDAAGRRRVKSFGRKLDADRYLATTQTDQLRGAWVDPGLGRATVRQYAETWLRVRDVRETTRQHYERDYLPFWNRLGDRALADLTPSMMKEWQSALTPQLSVAVANACRGIFAAMLNDAVIDGRIARSPFVGVKRLRVPPKADVEPLGRDVVFKMADTITDRYRAAVLVAIGSGLRRGEVFALCTDCVDFLRRTIRVHAEHGGLIELDGQRPTLGPPKTAASARVVPVSRHVIDALAAHLQRFPAGEDRMIFRTGRGSLVRETTFASAWRRTTKPDGARFHDLRHFYASALIAHGENVKVVQARLGHKSATETLDTYSHLWPNSEDSTRAALDDVFDPPALESLSNGALDS